MNELSNMALSSTTVSLDSISVSMPLTVGFPTFLCFLNTYFLRGILNKLINSAIITKYDLLK